MKLSRPSRVCILKATKYLKNVTLEKQWVPFRLQWWSWQLCPDQTVGLDTGQWPKKSAEFLLHVFKNAQSNGELKALDVESLDTEHIQVNKVPKMCPRTYRARGRINLYRSAPVTLR